MTRLHTDVIQWPLDKRPTYYAGQGDRFSDILHMLLKMRGLPPKASPRPDTGILKAVEGSDENVIRWFDLIRVTRKSAHTFNEINLTSSADFLEQRQAATYDPSDSRSFDFRYGAKLLPAANIYA